LKVERKTNNGGLKQLKLKLEGLDKQQIKVGWFDSAVYPNGTKVALIAAQNEFGNPNKKIPPRPFFRSTIKEKQTEWKEKLSKISTSILEQKINIDQGVSSFALVVEGDIKEKITNIKEPALKESTIKARKRKMKDGKTVGNLTKPLVETAHMLNTVTHVITKK